MDKFDEMKGNPRIVMRVKPDERTLWEQAAERDGFKLQGWIKWLIGKRLEQHQRGQETMTEKARIQRARRQLAKDNMRVRTVRSGMYAGRFWVIDISNNGLLSGEEGLSLEQLEEWASE